MAITLTSEVALIMLISWLPVGGTMDFIACGMMTRHSARALVMPKACAVSAWPLSTESSPPRMISAM